MHYHYTDIDTEINIDPDQWSDRVHYYDEFIIYNLSVIYEISL